MILIRKKARSDKKGETMVEVIVAFTLLSIMLVVFSQGITFAAKAENNAIKVRKLADEAMQSFQFEKANNSRNHTMVPIGVFGKTIYRQTYPVIQEGETHTYVVYVADTTSLGG
ncbi:MAG: type II secretion system protein [Clostridiales bacterium]|nr:type II secretion system protein [Clostridiales bacterium]